jgi:hypothetical protein
MRWASLTENIHPIAPVNTSFLDRAEMRKSGGARQTK